MLSPEVRKRIYEETKALLKAQIENQTKAKKTRERRSGCLLALFALLLVTLGDRRTK